MPSLKNPSPACSTKPSPLTNSRQMLSHFALKLLEYKQGKEKQLLKKARESPKEYSICSFCGGRKVWNLIIKNDKIVIPQSWQKRLVSWYHKVLCHPGKTQTEATIAQHFTWKNMRADVHKECTTCNTCQLTKKIEKIWTPSGERSGKPSMGKVMRRHDRPLLNQIKTPEGTNPLVCNNDWPGHRLVWDLPSTRH